MLTRRLLIAFVAVVFPAAVVSAANPWIDLGSPDSFVLDQPRVAVEVYDADPEYSYGPEMFNEFLLDTAAQSILVGSLAKSELDSRGFATVADFSEAGIGGSSMYRVSEVYQLDFAGSDGSRRTLPDVRMLASDTATLGGWGGVLGTPAMLNRVTSLDHVAMETELQIGVSFSQTLPAGAGHRYTVPIALTEFPPTGQQNPDDPLPTYGPLPLVQTTLRSPQTSAGASLVVDTGAQYSILSSSLAFSLGLDTDGDGTFDNEAEMFLPVTGAGGEEQLPLLRVGDLLLPTAEGVELLWTDAAMLIADISDGEGTTLDGVIGNEVLTGGWMDRVMGGGSEQGAIFQAHLDFRDPDNATMLLDLNPSLDVVVPEPATLGLLLLGAAGVIRRRTSRGCAGRSR